MRVILPTNQLSGHAGAVHTHFADQSVDFSYTYDPAGNLTHRNGTGGEDLSTTYDADGLASNVSVGTRNYEVTYTPGGQLASITHPGSSALTETWDYNADGLTTSVATTEAGAANPIDAFSYTRDQDGRVIGIDRTQGSTTTQSAFEYNRNGWLTSECRSAASCSASTQYVKYAYDANGNRTTETRVGVSNPGVTSNSYNAANQLVEQDTPAGTSTLTYDADGHLTSDGREWNARGQMTSSDIPGAGQATFTYDALGHRREVHSIAGNTTIAWDPVAALPSIASVTRPDGTVTTPQVVDGLTVGALSVPSNGSPSATDFAGDAMGSVTTLLDSAGATTGTRAYGAFGDLTELTGTQADGAALFGYTGAYAEPELGDDVYHLRARDYLPSAGRFVAPDAVGQALDEVQVSGYAYVDNDPLDLVDPSGNCPWCGVLGAAVGGLVGAAVYSATTNHFTVGGLLKATGTGALVGGVAGLTMGLSSAGLATLGAGELTTAIVSGGVSGLTATVTASLLSGNGLPTPQQALVGTAIGAAIPGASSALATMLKGSSIGPKCAEALNTLFLRGPGRTPTGGLQVVGSGFSDSERYAAQALAAQGRNVVLREADSAAARTSDLLVNNVAYDVYTPTTGNLDRIVSAIASKGSQVRGGGVVLDLSKSPLSAADVGDILPRVRRITSQISDIIVIGGS